MQRLVMMVAGLALVAATGCQSNKKKTHTERADATVEKENQEGETLGDVGDDVAEATREAAEDTLEATEEAEETIARGETLPPEPGVDMPETDDQPIEDNTRKTAEKIDETSDRAEKDIEKASKGARDTMDALDGKVVSATVASVSRTDERVTFRIEENVDEIKLQSGKEIDVPFGDLTLLTGMNREEAVMALKQGKDVKVKVLGSGNAMRIVEIELQAGEEHKEHHEKDGY